MARATTQIRIRGFARQSILTVEELTRLLESLPARHLVDLAEIVYDPTRFEQRLDAYYMAAPGRRIDLRCSAEYVRGSDRIVLYVCEDRARALHLLLHEIGHHVFHRAIEGHTRKRWVTEVHPRAGRISRYSDRNATEAFAEGYAAFALGLPTLQRIPAKHGFFAAEVFDGAIDFLKV